MACALIPALGQWIAVSEFQDKLRSYRETLFQMTKTKTKQKILALCSYLEKSELSGNDPFCTELIRIIVSSQILTWTSSHTHGKYETLHSEVSLDWRIVSTIQMFIAKVVDVYLMGSCFRFGLHFHSCAHLPITSSLSPERQVCSAFIFSLRRISILSQNEVGQLGSCI